MLSGKDLAAIVYVLLGYVVAIGLLLATGWLKLIGVLLLTHVLLISAVLTHEFLHGNIFKTRSQNVLWGTVMTHLNGACYASWRALEQHHFNHHLYHADFVPFDIAAYIASLPVFIRRLITSLEWLYFPAIEFILRLRTIIAPFQDPQSATERRQILFLLAYRSSLFALLGWLSWSALMFYAVAYICFVNLMRFADAFSHTYEYAIAGQTYTKHDRIYEQSHTLSNLLSVHYPWLNLLYLNFGYHAAHHYDMRCSWHQLPELHHRLYGQTGGNIVTLPSLIRNYHRFRLTRLSSGQGEVDISQPATLNTFTGAIGVSFLTPP